MIIDGENMPYTPGAVDSSIPRADRGALHVEGDWWRFIGLEIINGPYGIFGVDTNNGRYERLVTRDNYESGLHLQGASGGNQIINLDSFGNRDPRNNGESADGLAIKEGSGSGNVVRGARLWNNSDDGFDAWEFLSPITVENSVAYGNGFNRWGIPNYTGDGNGFKIGGGDVDLPAAHVTRNSMAWDNAVGGFIDNANPGALGLRPQHRLAQRRHRLRLVRRHRLADPQPGRGQRYERDPGQRLQLGQLMGHRRHLELRSVPTLRRSPDHGRPTARSRPRTSCGRPTAPTSEPGCKFPCPLSTWSGGAFTGLKRRGTMAAP